MINSSLVPCENLGSYFSSAAGAFLSGKKAVLEKTDMSLFKFNSLSVFLNPKWSQMSQNGAQGVSWGATGVSLGSPGHPLGQAKAEVTFGRAQSQLLNYLPSLLAYLEFIPGIPGIRG